MLPLSLCSLWPLLALALGGSPHAPHPNLGAPQPHPGAPQPHLGAPQPHLGAPQPHLGAPQPHLGAPLPHSHQDPQGLFYDHAALWGAQEAREQRELPPEESRRRLGLLVGLMDADSSGLLSREELRAWILNPSNSREFPLNFNWNFSNFSSQNSQFFPISRLLVGLMDADSSGLLSREELRAWILRRHRGSRQAALRSESERLDRDSDGLVTWAEFSAQSFGDTEDFGGSPDPDSHRKLLERSRRRFRAADEDGDGRLEAAELDAFLHPEDFPRLQDLVVQETIEDLDRDGDGFIQVDEYIADLFEGPPGSPEPPEIQRERDQFLRIRDQDQDGRLGPPEVKLWLSPPSPDWAGVEAEHLIHHADLNQDGALSREEILGRWEIFVGSRATDYGQDLHRGHDEL